MTDETSAPTFGTVLCPVDLSPHARAALYLAAGLTFSPASRLVVLLIDDRAAGDDEDARGARVELGEFVMGALPGPAGYRAGVELMVRSGSVTKTILGAAAEVDADLVVIGSHGRGRLGQALFGSTASALLRETHVPLAIVPPSHPEILSLGETRAVAHLGVILVPVDLTAPVSRQMAFAARLSPGSAEALALMHVAAPGSDVEARSTHVQSLAGTMPAARGWRVLVKTGTVVEQVLLALHHDKIGLVVLGQSSDAPGKLAYELIRRAGAVVVMVP